jgi:hypothetical protein
MDKSISRLPTIYSTAITLLVKGVMALTFCTDICCQITLNLKFIIVLVTICMNLISWQTAITDIYKHPVLSYWKIKLI